jgi:hypothetical protein
LRVVAVAMEALHRLGVADPARNFIVASQGALSEDGIPVVVLAKKSAFTEGEEAAVRAHLRTYPTLAALYLTSEHGQNSFSDLIARNDPYAFALSSLEILEGRPPLVHLKNHRGLRAKPVRFVEGHNVDPELALAQAVRNLVEQQNILRLMAARRILLFPV